MSGSAQVWQFGTLFRPETRDCANQPHSWFIARDSDMVCTDSP